MSELKPTNPYNLPDIPKALDTILSTQMKGVYHGSPSQWREAGKVYAAQLAVKQEEENEQKILSSNSTDHAKSMSTTLSNLRREMSALRQLDAHLLCQLMSISSSISELKAHEENLLNESTELILEEDDYDEDTDPMIITNGTISII